MTEKKVAGKRAATIILGIVCIALSVGLVIAVVAYLPTSDQIDSLNAQIVQKNQAITGLNAQITSLNDQIKSLSSQNNATLNLYQNQINLLQQEIQSLNNIVYLNASAFLVQTQEFSHEPNTNVTIWNQPETPLQNAGYVTVQVESSSDQTFVQAVYNSFGVDYNEVVMLGNGTAVFPVLPGDIVLTLGNYETNDMVNGTVTALYYY
jgi:cell division protein FtsL